MSDPVFRPALHIRGFNRLVGLEVAEASGDRVVVTLPVRDELFQVHGIVHGGVWCTLVETAASIGGGLWIADRGSAVGVSNHTDFLHALRSGTVTATATPVHRGRLQQLWLVEVRGDDGRLVARGEVRLQNLEDTAQLAAAASPTAGDEGP
ncbi:MAG: PaaI family thioesterase [Acidimicrobiales bacterium]|nr:PaaI family thioesterase [Acidimicrobiales bacterium]